MEKHNGQPDLMGNPIGGGAVSANVSEAKVSEFSNIKPSIPYTDLREWIDEARKLGEIKEVKGLSWQEDIGLVSELALHDDDAPCFVFEEVPGTIKGSRVLVNFFGGRRKNMTLGFPTELS